MLRIVIDTNVLIAAFFHDEVDSETVLRLVIRGAVSLLLTREIEDEYLMAILGHIIDAGVPRSLALAAMRKTLRLARKAVPVPSVTAELGFGCSDKTDEKFLVCAATSLADCVVSMDSHLSEVSVPPAPVLSPWQFLREHPGLKRLA